MDMILRDPVICLRQLRGRRLTLAAIATTLMVAAAVFATSCGGSGPADSGVRGRVWLGPLTPVEILGGPPNEKPYAATIQVLRAGSDHVVATTHSGSDGSFEVDLAAGSYVLQGVSPSPLGMPSAAPVAVVVVAHRFATAVVSFDTGIR
jgi:hypothetical protein